MAQFWARTLSTSRTVTFGNASSYQIAGEKDFANSSATYTVKLNEAPYQATITSAQFGSTTGVSSVTFNGFGMPNNAGTITLQAGGVTKTITVSAYDGGVSIR